MVIDNLLNLQEIPRQTRDAELQQSDKKRQAAATLADGWEGVSEGMLAAARASQVLVVLYGWPWAMANYRPKA